jgi:hypothetical protein
MDKCVMKCGPLPQETNGCLKIVQVMTTTSTIRAARLPWVPAHCPAPLLLPVPQ